MRKKYSRKICWRKYDHYFNFYSCLLYDYSFLHRCNNLVFLDKKFENSECRTFLFPCILHILNLQYELKYIVRTIKTLNSCNNKIKKSKLNFIL